MEKPAAAKFVVKSTFVFDLASWNYLLRNSGLTNDSRFC